MDLEKLGEVELDALRELGNIGVGRAATSLSQMLGKPVNMSVPQVLVVKFSELHKVIDPEVIVSGIVTVLDDLERGQAGFLYVAFPDSSSEKLALQLLGDAGDEEMVDSTIVEVGNIISSSFCDAIAEMLGTVVIPSPPSFAKDYAVAVVDALLSQLAESSDRLLVFETELESEGAVRILVILIPNEKFIGYVFDMLGMVE